MMMRLLPVIAVATLLAGCNTSYNYFEDDRSEMPESENPTAFGVILGMAGVTASKKPQIDYSARAPLAMPPGRDLPPPREDLPTTATDAVDWPQDPDVLEEERRRANLEAGA